MSLSAFGIVMDGWMDGRTDRWMDGRTKWKKYLLVLESEKGAAVAQWLRQWAHIQRTWVQLLLVPIWVIGSSWKSVWLKFILCTSKSPTTMVSMSKPLNKRVGDVKFQRFLLESERPWYNSRRSKCRQFTWESTSTFNDSWQCYGPEKPSTAVAGNSVFAKVNQNWQFPMFSVCL